MNWLPGDFSHPVRLELGDGDHLRPIRATDVPLDYPAVMGSRARLWSIFGEAWGWPPATMTYAADRADLARHERENEAHESFCYAAFDADETRLLGCVYIDPPAPADGGHGAVVSWWVVDEVVDTRLDAALRDLVPAWLERDWPFDWIRYAVE